MTKQSLKDNVISNEIQSKKFWSLTTPKMCFYWRLLKKKFENIEGNFLARVQEKQDIFLEILPYNAIFAWEYPLLLVSNIIHHNLDINICVIDHS